MALLRVPTGLLARRCRAVLEPCQGLKRGIQRCDLGQRRRIHLARERDEPRLRRWDIGRLPGIRDRGRLQLPIENEEDTRHEGKISGEIPHYGNRPRFVDCSLPPLHDNTNTLRGDRYATRRPIRYEETDTLRGDRTTLIRYEETEGSTSQQKIVAFLCCVRRRARSSARLR